MVQEELQKEDRGLYGKQESTKKWAFKMVAERVGAENIFKGNYA